MQILVTMAGFSFAQADNIRRAMSKKKKEVIEKERINFITSAVKKGYNETKAVEVYNLILKFANYGFNKAHSVSYALIGYQMAYLKVHYKEVFLANLLNMTTSNSKKTEDYLNIAKKDNITILLPNINKSKDVYLSKNNYLLLPLSIIKNIGSNTVNLILQDREENGLYIDYFDLVRRFYKLGIKKNAIESLIYAKALDTFKINHKTMINMLDEVLRYAEVCDNLDVSLVEKPILKIEDEFDDKTLMNQELNVYGFYVSNHPASKYKAKDIIKIKNIKAYLGKNVKMVILVNDIRKIKTKKNEDMAFINGTDETGSMDFVVFPKKINYLESLSVGSLVVVMGTVARRIDKYQININVVRSI